MKRRGFTLLELLIVVGLIALLSGLLVMAIGHMRTSAKRQQTTVMLENLRAMYADYDAMAHRHFVSYRDPLYNGNNVDMPCPQNVTNDFAGMAPASLTTLPISLDRNGYAVLLARDVMNQMRQTTTNATSLGKMPASSLMRFTQTAAPAPFNPTTTTPYHMLDRVYVMSINPTTFTYYTCIEYNPPVGIPPLVVPPPNTNFWFPSTFYANDPTAPTLVGADNTAPVGLDAWGNPIIFVPGGSLGTGAALVPDPNNPTGPAIVGVGSGAILVGGIGAYTPPQASSPTTRVRSPDGRPFWASAGADGDFSKGDDNIYSFEK